MILDATTRSIQIKLGEAKTTNDCDIVAAWADQTTSAFTPGATTGASNGTTAVTVVAAPASSTQRQVKEIRFHNNDTVSHTVTLIYNDNATLRTIGLCTVAANGDALYTPGTGWVVPSSPAVVAPVSMSVARGAGGTASSNSVFNVGSVVLGAGNWLLSGNIGFDDAASAVLETTKGWISTTSATDPSGSGPVGNPNSGAYAMHSYSSTAFNGGNDIVESVGVVLQHFTATATVYLSGLISFTGTAPTYYGFLGATPINSAFP